MKNIAGLNANFISVLTDDHPITQIEVVFILSETGYQINETPDSKNCTQHIITSHVRFTTSPSDLVILAEKLIDLAEKARDLEAKHISTPSTKSLTSTHHPK